MAMPTPRLRRDHPGCLPMTRMLIPLVVCVLAGCSAASTTPDVDRTTPQAVHVPAPAPVSRPATPSPSRTTPRPAVVPRPLEPAPVKRPAAPPVAKEPAAPAAGLVVHAGAYCSPPGATGRTAKGTLLTCRSKAGDRPRWRS